MYLYDLVHVAASKPDAAQRRLDIRLSPIPHVVASPSIVPAMPVVQPDL